MSPHNGRVAQLVRAPASHAGGPGFESLRAHHECIFLRLRGHANNMQRPEQRHVGGPLIHALDVPDSVALA